MKLNMTSRATTPAMQELYLLLLRSEKFLNWKPERFQDKSGDSRLRPENPNPALSADDKHFTPQDLAEAWGVDVETIRNIFREEPGVLKIGRDSKKRRAYVTLRIPEEIAERVHKRLAA